TIPDLITLTRKATSPSYETRKMAVVALSTVAQPFEKGKEPDAKVITALYASLKPLNEKASAVRLAALNSLVALRVHELASHKPDFEAGVEPVAQKDPERLLRINAHLSLYKLKTKVTPDKRLEAIAKMMLDDKEVAVRMEAARALGLIGKDSLKQLNALLKAIDDKEGVVGAAAVWSMANIGRKDTGTKKILTQFVQTHP